MKVRRLPLILPGMLAAGLLLGGCVAPGATQTADAENFNDPFEDTNRAVFGFNQTVDANVLVPAAKAYRTVVPGPVRQGVVPVPVPSGGSDCSGREPYSEAALRRADAASAEGVRPCR